MPNDPLKEIEARIREVIIGLPRKVGDATVNFALDNFNRQGFLGYTLQPWLPRKRETKKTAGRRILEGPRLNLKRSIVVLRTEPGQAVVGSSRPYAKAHNEGFRGTVTVRAHDRLHFTRERVGSGKFTAGGKERTKTISRLSHTTRVESFERRMNLPRRQFLGASPYLEATITRIIAADIMRAAKL